MTTNLRPLEIRKMLNHDYGRKWSIPEPFGMDGWSYVLPGIVEQTADGTVEAHSARTLIVSCADHEPDGAEWIHASIAGSEMPTYDDLCRVHRAVFRDGYAYQLFVPRDKHVNIHRFALHLYGRLDGKPVTPEFSGFINGKRSI